MSVSALPSWSYRHRVVSIISRLCIPLTATSQALFTKCRPWISEKSSAGSFFPLLFLFLFNVCAPRLKYVSFLQYSAPQKFLSLLQALPLSDSPPVRYNVMPRSFASATIGSIPLTGFTSPLKLISPTTIVFFNASSGTMPMAQSTAATTGRSKPDPVFLILAGIKLIVIRFGGRIYPVFFSVLCAHALWILLPQAKVNRPSQKAACHLRHPPPHRPGCS